MTRPDPPTTAAPGGQVHPPRTVRQAVRQLWCRLTHVYRVQATDHVRIGHRWVPTVVREATRTVGCLTTTERVLEHRCAHCDAVGDLTLARTARHEPGRCAPADLDLHALADALGTDGWTPWKR